MSVHVATNSLSLSLSPVVGQGIEQLIKAREGRSYPV